MSKKRDEYLKLVGKTLLFPKAKKFSDLFGDPEPGKRVVAVKTEGTGRHKESMAIGNWISIRNDHSKLKLPHSMHAPPKQNVLDALDREMIVVKYDTVYFEIIVRGAREALVTAKYNTILGDRWLGFIDPRSIPQTAG